MPTGEPLEARQVAVREKACPLFVPLVEEGWVEHPVTEQVARIYFVGSLFPRRRAMILLTCWCLGAHIIR